MNLQTAIAIREHRKEMYEEAVHLVDQIALQSEEKMINKELKKNEVADLCEISPNTLYKWDTNASTYNEWCEFLKDHINGKYYKKFKRNYKRQL